MPGFRCQQVPSSTRQAELRASLSDAALTRQRKYLITSTVGQYRTGPTHEAVDVAEAVENPRTGRVQQMVGVGQDELGAGAARIVHRDLAEAGARGYRHEHRRRDIAPARVQHPRACALSGRAQERKTNGHRSRKWPCVATLSICRINGPAILHVPYEDRPGSAREIAQPARSRAAFPHARRALRWRRPPPRVRAHHWENLRDIDRPSVVLPRRRRRRLQFVQRRAGRLVR